LGANLRGLPTEAQRDAGVKTKRLKRTGRSIYKHLVAPRMQKPRKGRSKRDWNGRPEKATEVTQKSRQKN